MESEILWESEITPTLGVASVESISLMLTLPVILIRVYSVIPIPLSHLCAFDSRSFHVFLKIPRHTVKPLMYREKLPVI
jgi:hypothetical protein